MLTETKNSTKKEKKSKWKISIFSQFSNRKNTTKRRQQKHHHYNQSHNLIENHSQNNNLNYNISKTDPDSFASALERKLRHGYYPPPSSNGSSSTNTKQVSFGFYCRYFLFGHQHN